MLSAQMRCVRAQCNHPRHHNTAYVMLHTKYPDDVGALLAVRPTSLRRTQCVRITGNALIHRRRADELDGRDSTEHRLKVQQRCVR